MRARLALLSVLFLVIACAILVDLALAQTVASEPSKIDLPDDVSLTLEVTSNGTGHEYRGVLRITSVVTDSIEDLRLTSLTCLEHETAPGVCRISETDITVTPAEAVTLQPGETLAFDIRLDGLPPVTGQYTGTFEVTYQSGPSHTVTLLLRADPAYVEIDKAALNLQLDTGASRYTDSFVLSLNVEKSRHSEVTDVQFSPGSLQRVDKGALPDSAPIWADQITVSPASIQTLSRGAPAQTVTVSAAPPTGAYFPAGTYEGAMIIYYHGTGAQSQPDYSLTLTLTLVISGPVLLQDQQREPLTLLQQAPEQPYGVTFHVKVESGEMRNIVFQKDALTLQTPEGETIRIEPRQIVITPDTTNVVIRPETGPYPFSVEVTPPTGSNFYEGTYTGTLGMSYANGHTSFDLELIASPDATLEWTRDKNTDRISVKATTRPFASVETYSLPLEETGKVSTARLTEIAAEDLLNKDDVASTLPNSVMPPLTQSMTVPAGETEWYSLTFDFRGQQVRPGVYNGWVRVEGDNVDALRLPLQISLRHPFFPWPFLTFVLGTLLAVGLQVYFSKYHKRDQLLSAIEYWKSNPVPKDDGEPKEGDGKTNFEKFYGPFVTRRLDSAKSLLTSPEWGKQENLDQAESLVKEVRTLQYRWLAHQQAFKREQDRLEDLDKKLKEKYGQPVSVIDQYRYLLARQRELGSIRANLDLDTYDTGQKLEAAVTAEVLRFEAFDRGYEARKQAEKVIDEIQGLSEGNLFDLQAPGLPAPLKQAFKERADAEDKVLRESEDHEAIKSARAKFLTIVQDLAETVSQYKDVVAALNLLARRLALPGIRGELEGDEKKDYYARFRELKGKLAAAGAKTDLPAVSAAADKITEDLQRLYTSDRLFYYRETERWIGQIDEARTKQYFGWDEVRSRMDNYKDTARELVETTEELYDLASNYMFCRWRILWFYQAVMPWVYDKLGGQLPEGEVKSRVTTVVRWLLGNTHHVLTPEQFDREFLDNHVEKVYDAVNATLPEPLTGPPVAPRHERPSYRPLPTEAEEKAIPGGPREAMWGELEWREGSWDTRSWLMSGWDWASPLSPPGQVGVPSELWRGRGNIGAAISAWWRRLKGFLAAPDFRLGLFGLGVWILAFVVLLYFGWSEWNQDASFGDSGADYFKLVFLSFVGLTATDNIVKSALGTLQGWGAELPKTS